MYQYIPRLDKNQEVDYLFELNNLLDIFKKNDIEIHNIMATHRGKVCYSFYNEPYLENRPHILHSLTKLFTNTAVAQANMQGLVKLDDKVIDFFMDNKEEYLPNEISANLAKMTVKDLLTMRSGHDREISGSEWRPLKTSWIKAFFEEPVIHEPGSYYCYSSACSYMLSAIVQKITGETAYEYLNNGILRKLGIEPFHWDKSPEGINSGGNGISMRIEDVLKLALLYERGGIWNGERLIAQDWIDQAFGIEDNVDADEIKYNFHMFEFGNIYSPSGIFGQNAMIIPKLEMVIVVFAATKNWEDVPRLTDKYFVNKILENQKPKKINRGMGNRFISSSLLHSKKSNINYNPFNHIVQNFKMKENEDLISNIGFQQLSNKVLVVHMSDHRGEHTIHCGFDEWLSCVSSVTGNYLHHQYQSNNAHIVSKAWWVTPEILSIELRFIGTAFCDFMTFSFTNNYKTITFNRWVNVNTQAEERKTITGYSI